MLIDKDLRLSISGCFWLFYASKYMIKALNILWFVGVDSFYRIYVLYYMMNKRIYIYIK